MLFPTVRDEIYPIYSAPNHACSLSTIHRANLLCETIVSLSLSISWWFHLWYPTTQGAQYFADLVQQQTGGKVVIQVKANGEYGSEQQVWEQLAIGGVDFARAQCQGNR